MNRSRPPHAALRRRDFLKRSGAALAGALLLDRAIAAGPVAPARVIDTHTHFYDPSRAQGVPWPPKGDDVLHRTVLPAEFRALTKPFGVTGTVIVEASPWLEDNQWILDLAKDDPFIVGFVGNLPEGTPEFKSHLARFAGNPLFRGIRVKARSLADGVTQDAFREDMRRLSDADLEVDLVGGPALLAGAVALTRAVPELRIVIDHLPFDPLRDEGARRQSEQALRELGKHPRVFAKVSNIVRPVGDRVPDDAAFYKPALDAAWEVFGPDRVIYGSNWPVSDRVAPYATVFKVASGYFTAKGQEAADKYFWKNAQAAYRWVDRKAG